MMGDDDTIGDGVMIASGDGVCDDGNSGGRSVGDGGAVDG